MASSSLLSICFVAFLENQELLFPVTLAMFALSSVAEVRIVDFAALQSEIDRSRCLIDRDRCEIVCYPKTSAKLTKTIVKFIEIAVKLTERLVKCFRELSD